VWNKNTLTAIVIVLLSLAVWRGTADLSEMAAVFPRAIAVVLIILGIVLLINGLTKKDKTNPFTGIALSRLVPMFIALAMYVGLIPFIGFILSSTLFLTFSFLYFGEGKSKVLYILKQLLLAFVISIGFYAIFYYGFRVPIPTGSLWGFLS